MRTMQKRKSLFSAQEILQQLIQRTGKYYHLVLILLAQLFITYPVGGLTAQVVQINAELTDEAYLGSATAEGILLTIGNLIVIAVIYFLTRDMGARLEQWKNGRMIANLQQETKAWRQITSLPWRFGLVSLIVSLFFDLLPLFAYQFLVLQLDYAQIIYTFFGGIAATIVNLGINILLLEMALKPARQALLPATFEAQLTGISGLQIRQKFTLFVISLLILSAVIITPIGYSRIYTVIYKTISSQEVLVDYQTFSIVFSVSLLVIGALIAILLSLSVSSPIGEMVQTFNAIEKGDLKQRAIVSGTDEVGQLAVYFNRMVARLDALQQNLEKRVQAQTEKLRASNEVGRIASTILDPDDLVSQVVGLISRTFDYYYVALFLVNENGRWAELKDATGAAGEILKARRHRLQIGGNSMVGASITNRAAQVAMDVGEAAVRFNNPLLPNTRSEIALPLIVGDRVIGALDVQSTREADFKPEDISTLQSMANQVGIALDNARNFKDMEIALQELRVANSKYLTSAWADRAQTNLYEHSTHNAPENPEAETQNIQIGLNLREQAIGQLSIETDGDWTAEDQTWVESLATQVAISLENSRLIEESQQSAVRERLSASIIQKLWSSPSVDAILQTAVRELGRAFEAAEATIELKVDEDLKRQNYL